MPEWFLGPPQQGAAVPSRTLLRTEVSDTAGAVLVETRRLGTPEEEAGDDGQSARWETTICPRDATDPLGPDAAVFAVSGSPAEAHAAHEQAVAFSAAALGSTARRAGKL